ncbi:serine/threonine-protein kinase [Pseudonocardia nigra]|uniref:serine/threonine-protein kinase n=1 Tax=Pseudonocardia nigra TaxID=1921578 RepID=UPI0027E2B4B1|nr:protein kinase [Pseudonocardia nigra]
MQRFRGESHAAARLNDPHVIPIHRYGEIDGRLYIDMRLVDGVDLATLIARDGPLSAARVVSIVAQAAEALDAAHAAGLIHRDVKPSNLLVTPHDFVYLVDFGIAHAMGCSTRGQALTATGATVGTLDYMAPERIRGGSDVDGRADVYSLACVLYETLTGQRPFPVEGLPALLHAHLHRPPPVVTAVRPELPSGLDDVVARGMAKDPVARYATAGDLAAAARAVRDLRGGHVAATVTARGPLPQAPTSPARPPAFDAPPTRMAPGGSPRWSATPGPSPGRGRVRGASQIVAVAALVVLAVVVGVTLGRGEVLGAGNAAPEPSGPAATDAAGIEAAGTDAAGTAAATEPAGPPSTGGPPASPGPSRPLAGDGGAGDARALASAPPAVGDLGLSTPISDPPCTGRFVTFVGSAVTPGAHRAEVASLLAQHPGSSYLLAETGCASLRPRLPDGRSICSVYLGPYATPDQACSARRAAGGDSYVKVLDEVTPVDRFVEC